MVTRRVGSVLTAIDLTAEMSQDRSVFGFAGSLERLSIRVQLFQKGIQTLDFDKFHQEAVIDEQPTRSRLDDVTFGWKQRVGKPENSNRRIFTLHEDDDFPDYLSAFKPSKEPEEEKEEEPVEEVPCNDYVVFRKSRPIRTHIKKSYVLIFARVGPMDLQDPSAVEFIARITVTDTKQLIVEPALNSDEGIVLETKFGDFTVKIRFGDKEEDAENKMIEMARGSRKMRASVSSIPESEQFVAARDGQIETVVNVNFVEGVDFLFDEGLTIEYMIKFPSDCSFKSDNRKGRSQRYSADENGKIHFGYLLEFVIESPDSDVCPLLMIRIMAVDSWGRQYIAGYGSTYISLKPGRNTSKISLWRPINHNSLYEMFVGQAIDVDYFRREYIPKFCGQVDGQPSGTLLLTTCAVSQSKQYMAKDILDQLRYGSKMANMGLRSDFYQRIIKVLTEFQEARAKLINARAINKLKIKQ